MNPKVLWLFWCWKSLPNDIWIFFLFLSHFKVPIRSKNSKCSSSNFTRCYYIPTSAVLWTRNPRHRLLGQWNSLRFSRIQEIQRGVWIRTWHELTQVPKIKWIHRKEHPDSQTSLDESKRKQVRSLLSAFMSPNNSNWSQPSFSSWDFIRSKDQSQPAICQSESFKQDK